MTDHHISETLDGNIREQVKHLLCELIAIPSYAAQEETILGYLAQRFQGQRIHCRLTELDGKPLNVIAEIGAGSRTIVLNSHVDTVPPGDTALWHTDPLVPVEKDGRIYGRGAMDAKGCLAAMIVAFEELARRRDDLPGRVILMAVGGEERGGLGTKTEVANGLRANAALVELLADTLGVPKGRVLVKHGALSRNKAVEILGMSRDEALRRISSALRAT